MTDIYNRKAVAWAEAQRTEPVLKPELKPMLIAIARCANSIGDCFASQLRLAAMTGQCVRTVRRKLHALRDAGLIDIEHRYDENHERMTSRITLRMFEEKFEGVA